MDWRIIAASFAALIVIVSLLFNGVGGNFSGIFKNVGGWLSSSPFSGFVVTPEAKTHSLDLILYPEQITIKPDSDVNISIKGTKIDNFLGNINVNFKEGKITFEQEKTSLKFESAIESMEIDGFKVSSFYVDNMQLKILPDTVSNNGSVQMKNFNGKLIITEANIQFSGNVSKVTARIDKNLWELK